MLFGRFTGWYVELIKVYKSSNSFPDFSDSSLNEALNFCCKTGTSLDSCSEKKMNQTAHNPPIGVCRTTMRLCCLYNPGITRCEKDFIVNSFERYCDSDSSA